MSLDIPALTHGIDLGVEPTPFEQAQRLAAEAWGAKRAWFLVNGASQGNLAAGLALAHYGRDVVVQRNAHSSTIDALVLSGMRPTFAAPEVDPELGIAHCLTPRDARAGARADAAGRRRVGRLADVLRRGRRRPLHWPRSRTRAACRWSWTRRGARTWPSTRSFPSTRWPLGADLVISSTHKIVGSLTQSAMLHLGHGGDELLIGADAVDRAVTLTESTSPNSLLCGSLDAARRQAAVHGRELLGRTMAALRLAREEIRAIEGLDVLDERIAGRSGRVRV